MSASHPRRSHAIAWTLCVLALPMLYVLTLPPILYFAATRFSHSQPVGNFMHSYSAPYGWLIEQEPLQRPLQTYGEFWRTRFGYDLAPLH